MARSACSGARSACVGLCPSDDNACVAWQSRFGIDSQFAERRQRPLHTLAEALLHLSWWLDLVGVSGDRQTHWVPQLFEYGTAELSCAIENAESK